MSRRHDEIRQRLGFTMRKRADVLWVFENARL